MDFIRPAPGRAATILEIQSSSDYPCPPGCHGMSEGLMGKGLSGYSYIGHDGG